MEKYFANFSESKVHSLADIIAWNDAHPDIAFTKTITNQDEYHAALADDTAPEELAAAISSIRAGSEVFDELMDKHNLDIVAGPADCSLICYAAAAGYPNGVVPVGEISFSNGANKRPQGLCMIARAHRDDVILKFMAAWEDAMPARPIPRQLMA